MPSVSIPEAAPYSKICEAGLRSRIRVGSLPHQRVSPFHNIVIEQKHLDALLLTGGAK